MAVSLLGASNANRHATEIQQRKLIQDTGNKRSVIKEERKKGKKKKRP